MNIAIYRNKRNNDIKKVSKFVDNLRDKIPAKIDLTILQDLSKEDTVAAMNNAEIIIIFSHGSKDKIFFYISSEYNIGDNEGVVLINRQNAKVFSQKKVIVFACDTAIELGPYVVDQNQSVLCKSYIGFADTIDYGISNSGCDVKLLIGYFYKVYGAVFEDVIVTALNNNFTPSKLTRYFKVRLNKVIRDCKCDGVDIPAFPQEVLPKINKIFEKTLNAMIALGETNEALYTTDAS